MSNYDELFTGTRSGLKTIAMVEFYGNEGRNKICISIHEDRGINYICSVFSEQEKIYVSGEKNYGEAVEDFDSLYRIAIKHHPRTSIFKMYS